MLADRMDEQTLAHLAAAGNDRAFAELASRYRKLIGFVTRRPVPGLSREDLRQEALIGLLQACRAHDPTRGPFRKLAGACVRRRVWGAQRDASRAKQRVLTDALGLDHREHGDPDSATLAERLPARDAVDPARVVEARERLAEITVALRALTPRYREALLSEGQATAKIRCHARRRLQRLLEQGAGQASARVDGRCYTDGEIQRALALVAGGASLKQAADVVGASHTTVLRWRARAA